MSNIKNRKCSLQCDYISNVTDQYYGDVICFCNYDHKKYVGFIEDVDHGQELCIYPEHPLNNREMVEDMNAAWEDFITELKDTQLYEKFEFLADWIGAKLFR